MSKSELKAKRGPAKGQGGRPIGPVKVSLGTVRVLASTAEWLARRGQTAAQALDEISGAARHFPNITQKRSGIR